VGSNAKEASMFHSALSRRRAFTSTITTMALTALLLTAGAGTLSAQPTDKKALVGSWLGTVTFPPEFNRPPLTYVGSFHDDGTMVSSDQGGVTLDPPTVFSSFYGVWTHLDQRTFAYTGFEMISDLNGHLVGYLKARGVYTVSRSGNEYTGTTHAEVLNAEGNFMFSVDVTNTADRMHVERP
jgi:hypothetical protein